MHYISQYISLSTAFVSASSSLKHLAVCVWCQAVPVLVCCFTLHRLQYIVAQYSWWFLCPHKIIVLTNAEWNCWLASIIFTGHILLKHNWKIKGPIDISGKRKELLIVTAKDLRLCKPRSWLVSLIRESSDSCLEYTVEVSILQINHISSRNSAS